MCNRYSLTKKQERIITREFGSLERYFMERFNIAPTQSASVVLAENGKLVSKEMKWGFTAKWSKASIMNAQFESMEKPMFKEAFEKRRCLVPASGFYEWTDYLSRRQPILFQFKDERVFFFAGLYSTKDAEGNFVIITVPANEYVQKVHNRMPLIVAEGDYDAWLNPNSDSYKTVKPTSELLKTTWINPKVNNSRNENEESARPLMAKVKSIAGGYPLPNGLPEGSTVKILGFDHGYFDVEFEGKNFKVVSTGVELEGEEKNLL